MRGCCPVVGTKRGCRKTKLGWLRTTQSGPSGHRSHRLIADIRRFPQ